jgi:hypothetical protein
MHHTDPGLPQARDEHLLTRIVPDGLIVYDTDRHQAHSLNRTAALIWQRCDGRTTVSELTTFLQKELDLPAGERLIWLALSQLEQAQLLRERVTPGTESTGYSRRSLIRTIGITGGITALLPLVESLAAPAPADAASAAITHAQPSSNTVNTNSSTKSQSDPSSDNQAGNDPPTGSGDSKGQNQNSQNQGNNDNSQNQGKNDPNNNGSDNQSSDHPGPSDPPAGGNNQSGNSQDSGNRGDSSGATGQAVFKSGSD